MSSLAEYFNELDDEGMYEHAPRRRTNKPKVDPRAVEQFIQKQDEDRQDIAFTYKPARFEGGWLIQSLAGFFEQRWITDILSDDVARSPAFGVRFKDGLPTS